MIDTAQALDRELADFDVLWASHAKQLRSYAASLLRSRDDADDLFMDTYLRARSNFHRMRHGFAQWAFTIMRNRWVDIVRSATSKPSIPLHTEYDCSDWALHYPDFTECHRDLVLAKMSQMDADIVSLRLDGFLLREIADLLSISEPAVKARLSRLEGKYGSVAA